MNTQKEILSFSEYIKYIEENYSRNSLFRGLKDKSFALIPKIGKMKTTTLLHIKVGHHNFRNFRCILHRKSLIQNIGKNMEKRIIRNAQAA